MSDPLIPRKSSYKICLTISTMRLAQEYRKNQFHDIMNANKHMFKNVIMFTKIRI